MRKRMDVVVSHPHGFVRGDAVMIDESLYFVTQVKDAASVTLGSSWWMRLRYRVTYAMLRVWRRLCAWCACE